MNLTPAARALQVLPGTPGYAHAAVPTLSWPARVQLGLSDFVPGGFPLPWTPVYDGMGEFVPGGFPLPQTPVYFASANGSLPKAPDLPMAAINGNGAYMGPCGMGSLDCGCGGTCGSCGMGALSVPMWAATLPAPLNSTWGGIPVVYIAGGVLIAFMLMKRGRR